MIVMLVFDVIAVAVASYSFLLRRPFVEGKWRVFLAGDDGRKRDLVGDIVFELVLCVVVDFVGDLEKLMGATHFGRFVLVEGSAFVCRGMAALEMFLVGKDVVT